MYQDKTLPSTEHHCKQGDGVPWGEKSPHGGMNILKYLAQTGLWWQKAMSPRRVSLALSNEVHPTHQEAQHPVSHFAIPDHPRPERGAV